MIKDVTTEQIETIKRSGYTYNPKQEAFIKTLEAFIATQNMLEKSDITELTEHSRKVGASEIVELLSAINQSNEKTQIVPVKETNRTFNAGEFAEICGVSVQLVRRECERGSITAEKGTRNSWIIPEKELENPIVQRWLKSKKTMWKEIKQAKEVLKDSPEFIEGLKEIEDNRKSESHS
ncbi:MerR family transcriptional regulator [Planococcus lenghuensis]|uniref:Helix-turn-helix domain-containing protein n=1 Tax=Planococcus lenghuensis TaxID=2213202 RepID=A0A1Q2L1D5_9BACL|nr:hypothetical protein [Planococcus lenghuensis]AQQ54184.1 hypothetical protein B0X71_14435 [Planococcus lenghuensis]